MMQPPGFVHPQFPQHICKLKKALYDLKSWVYWYKAWYKELSFFLLDTSFTNTISDASLLIYNKNGIIVYMLVYVDDIVVTENNNNFLAAFFDKLSNRFSLKDLGILNYFLGVGSH